MSLNQDNSWGWDFFDGSLSININNINIGFHVEANIYEGPGIDVHFFELGLHHYYHCKGDLVKT